MIRSCTTDDDHMTDVSMLHTILKEVSCKMKIAHLNHPIIQNIDFDSPQAQNLEDIVGSDKSSSNQDMSVYTIKKNN